MLWMISEYATHQPHILQNDKDARTDRAVVILIRIMGVYSAQKAVCTGGCYLHSRNEIAGWSSDVQ